ncbi:CynX/NimT family MFS transporter [Ruicaihuangia caeni]|uniref:MFS transporter n=1 Tax=Ruicaihuangia caeni TaxID=3042517 RepID=A0AAW6T7E1_9MICO|nr:MFS transporter [Klugiella sp. YN-L-19]MDI2099016.1 MFS transporter [Klugiella sp. YN-L-19]
MRDRGRRWRDGRQALFVAAILAVALNARATISAPAPVLPQIQRDLGMDSAVAGLLVGLPILLFALAVPLASVIIRKLGPDRAVDVMLGTIVLGVVVRSLGTAEFALAGTVVLGAALTIGNIAVPVIIGRELPLARAIKMNGVFAAFSSGGMMITFAATAPLALAFGWEIAIASWGVLAVIAWIPWLFARRSGAMTAAGEQPERAMFTAPIEAISTMTSPTPVIRGPVNRRRGTWTSLSVWLIAGTFACHNFAFNVLSGWLPTILVERTDLSMTSAGLALSMFMGCGIVGAMLFPMLVGSRPPAPVLALVGTLWMSAPFGLLLAPSLWPIWLVLGGLAQSGLFTVLFGLIYQRAVDSDHTRRMLAMVQMIAYTSGATSASIAGWQYDSTGDWTLPLITTAAATVVMSIGAVSAGILVWRERRSGR